VFRRQDDQPRLAFVRYVRAGAWHRVHPCEIAGLSDVGAETGFEFNGHPVGVTFELFRPLLRELGHGGLGGVPEARPVLIEVGGCGPQPPERISKDRR
jgi:hypothetical protein